MSGDNSRGSGSSTRALSSALRSAGIGGTGGSEDRMDLDGGVGRARRPKTSARKHSRTTPLDQSGRRSKETPYDKPNGKQLSSRISGMSLNGSSADGKQAKKPSKRSGPPGDPRRAPTGTAEVRKATQDRQKQHSNLSAILKSEETDVWLKEKLVEPGVLDFSNLGEDKWLLKHGAIPPGNPDAPPNTGAVFWKLAKRVETLPGIPHVPIHTLILNNNSFFSLSQLSTLPNSLPHIRALSLENNPIRSSEELKHLQSRGDQAGKASSGAGSLKSLIEINLKGCRFREEMILQPGGGEKYQHDILRRFPGLLWLDGEQLNRIIFPLRRQPAVRLTDAERQQLVARPFTFPFDLQANFAENGDCESAVMQFCAKFFQLWDANRSEVIHGYLPEATISVSPNTLPSRSFESKDVAATSRSRPKQVSFEAWVNLPGRNFFRGCTTIGQRQHTLKSPMDRDDLMTWLKKIPGTQHPLTDASAWSVDAWYPGNDTDRICAVIQGEFQELPSGTYRSFTRTFMLVAAPAGSQAQLKEWPCCILSDTMVVHSYLGRASFDKDPSKTTLAKAGVTIVPPVVAAPAGTSTTAPPAEQQATLIAQVQQRTGMNAAYSEMCLAPNGWDVERAVADFNSMRETIPAEAFA